MHSVLLDFIHALLSTLFLPSMLFLTLGMRWLHLLGFCHGTCGDAHYKAAVGGMELQQSHSSHGTLFACMQVRGPARGAADHGTIRMTMLCRCDMS
jgi:hypothetical protein